MGKQVSKRWRTQGRKLDHYDRRKRFKKQVFPQTGFSVSFFVERIPRFDPPPIEGGCGLPECQDPRDKILPPPPTVLEVLSSEDTEQKKVIALAARCVNSKVPSHNAYNGYH